MKRFKIVAVLGARPQFIKCAAMARILESPPIKKRLEWTWVNTGQHYDYRLSGLFFKELKLPQFKYDLRIGSYPHGKQTGLMLEKIERVLLKERPGLVLVFGDTNSTLAGALAASKLHIPVAHVEAGLRSFNRTLPEEVNRVLTDRVSSLLFCPTRRAVDQLKREGILRGVYLAGDVMADLLGASKKILKSGGRKKSYYLATVHRNTNTDNRARLSKIFKALGALDKEVIFPLHPRTRDILRRDAGLRARVRSHKNLKLAAPASYLNMIRLEKNSAGIITDSGGVQKEAFLLGVPCVTLREETEWTETVRYGLNTLCRPNARDILKAFKKMNKRKLRKIPPVFGRGDASKKIVSRLVGYLNQSGNR